MLDQQRLIETPAVGPPGLQVGLQSTESRLKGAATGLLPPVCPQLLLGQVVPVQQLLLSARQPYCTALHAALDDPRQVSDGLPLLCRAL